MIELAVEDYCERCPSFEAIQRPLYKGSEHFIVTCKNKSACDVIHAHLFSHMQSKSDRLFNVTVDDFERWLNEATTRCTDCSCSDCQYFNKGCKSRLQAAYLHNKIKEV